MSFLPRVFVASPEAFTVNAQTVAAREGIDLVAPIALNASIVAPDNYAEEVARGALWIHRLRLSHIVLVDLTTDHPLVEFCAGMALGLGRPLIGFGADEAHDPDGDPRQFGATLSAIRESTGILVYDIERDRALERAICEAGRFASERRGSLPLAGAPRP